MAILTQEIIDSYLPTIGIECHVQLKTKTKLFTSIDNDSRGKKPNSTVGPLCFALPGTLPVLNHRALELAIRAGLAMNCQINLFSRFDRKHYFYPDLPKGYQITQLEFPTVGTGVIAVELDDGSSINVRITRAHIEEDAGKLSHPEGQDYSLVDLNRAGTPLIEIVSEPDIHSSTEAKAYCKTLYLLMKYADVSDVDLFHGNMRFDVNISMAKKGAKELGKRAEIKNLNSFRSVEKAVEYEIKRQVEILENGEVIVQETRGWNDAKQKTFSQRSKEDAHDYRYFPEPDLPPIELSEDYIDSIRQKMPELPAALKVWLLGLGVSAKSTTTLINEPKLVSLLQEARDAKAGANILKLMANLLTSEVQRITSDSDYDWNQFKLSSKNLQKLAVLTDEGVLNSTSAKELLLELLTTDIDPLKLAESKNLIQDNDADSLNQTISEVIEQNPSAVSDYKNGEVKALGFLVGQAMKLSGGKANPGLVSQLLREQLK